MKNLSQDEKRSNRISRVWLLALIWMAVIFAFSSQANSGAYTETYLQQANVPVRKLAHMCEFAVLALLFQNALKPAFLMPAKTYWIALVMAILYALSDEWHQSFVVGRSASLFDAGVDTAGATIGLGIAYLWRKFTLKN